MIASTPTMACAVARSNDSAVRSLTLDPEQAGWLERLAGRDFEGRLVKALDSHKPQLVIAMGGFGLDAVAIRAVRSGYSARWVNWFPGDLRVVNPARQLAPAYDRMYLTGTDVTEEVQRGGVTPAVFLPLGCDPSVHKPMRAKGPFRANVVFAGEATPRREMLLNELVEFGLAVWGESWKKTSLKDYCRGGLPTTGGLCAGLRRGHCRHQCPSRAR